MRPTGVIAIALALAHAVLTGCQSTPREPPQPQVPELKVGVTADNPPMVFKQGDGLAGIEVDFARALGERLHRPVRFVELPWDQQIPALLAGQTDIIMSGMSVTDARRVRIDFTDPYLRGGLMVMMRREDSRRYPSELAVLETRDVVGAVRGTTGFVFVGNRIPAARRIALATAQDAPIGLLRHEIDLFVHDAPAVIWLVSEHEADLALLRKPLNREDLAWGVRRADTELRRSADAALAQWRTDGTREAILGHWLPYLQVLDDTR